MASVFDRGLLSDLFIGVVVKTLTLVETVSTRSNQHEFQGTKPFRALFGTEDRPRIPTRFIALNDDGNGVTETGFVSWSNVRKGKPRAPEYHLYYSGNAITEAMKPAQTLFLALLRTGEALAIITPENSTVRSQLAWLFHADIETPESDAPDAQTAFTSISGSEDRALTWAVRYILEALGLDADTASDDRFDHHLEAYGGAFPTTRDFSNLARSTLSDITPQDDPDLALMAWLEREEFLFRRMERRLISERLSIGFSLEDGADVDGFIAFSLSVQNRRKARAGQSLEHHLEHLFRVFGLTFDRGVETENRNRPDFLFPGRSAYQDNTFPAERLTMLGAKSSLKDRWRQVLSEAARIPEKHLLTLEPGISEHQTREMQAKSLRLVLPQPLHSTYRPTQTGWLMTVQDFIRHRQALQIS